MKTILSLFDYTGNWSRPYREAGYNVVQVDIKLGVDIMTFDYNAIGPVHGILAAVPCTDFANAGARWFKAKDADGRIAFSCALVNKTMEIVEALKPEWWVIENPQSRIHKLNPDVGEIKHKFNPCDYAGYDPEPEKSRYNKKTWLFGKFQTPQLNRIEPLEKEYPGWKKLGGKSERTKELRSVTPLGFAYAFYKANH